MQIDTKVKIKIPTTPFEKELEKALNDYTYTLAETINGGLKISDNFSAYTVTQADTGGANVAFTVEHTLKRVPSGFLVVNIDKAGIIYDAGTAWTVDKIYLKCSVANCAAKIVIL